jgi:hypothetical protein
MMHPSASHKCIALWGIVLLTSLNGLQSFKLPHNSVYKQAFSALAPVPNTLQLTKTTRSVAVLATPKELERVGEDAAVFSLGEQVKAGR